MATRAKRDNANEKKEKDNLKCTMCGESKVETDFYKSNSPLFKGNKQKMCICKVCTIQLFDEFKKRHTTDILAIYEMCRTLEVYFSKKACETAITQSKNQSVSVASIYFQKINSLQQWNKKTFDESDVLFEEDRVVIEESNNEQKATPDMIMKWGNLAYEDIVFLDDNYVQWVTRHKCETKAEEILFEEICHVQLDIKRAREKGSDTVKKVEALQKLMTSANIQPLQQQAINSMDSALMIGTIIGIIEKNEPCEYFEEDRKKEYKDYKGYKRYFDNWSLRPLKNMLTGSKDLHIIKDDVDEPEKLESDEFAELKGENNGNL